MKRIQLVLAALAIVVASLAAFSGPAMAQNHDYDYPYPFDYGYEYPFDNDDYDYDYPYPFDYGYEYYDEGVYEEVQEAQAEYREDLAEIYEDSDLEGYPYLEWYPYW